MASLELAPSGDSFVQWTPSTGTDNYELVNEDSGLPNDLDYVSITANNNKDRYDWSYNILLNAATINYVRIGMRAKRVGVAEFKPFYYDGTSYHYGTESTLTTSFADTYYTWVTNPDGGSAWIGINDIQTGRWGIQSVLPRGRGNIVYVSNLWLIINYTEAAGYGNDVNGVDSGDIGKIWGVATADISKVNGV